MRIVTGGRAVCERPPAIVLSIEGKRSRNVFASIHGHRMVRPMTIRDTAAPVETGGGDLAEDLEALAEYEFRIAQTSCVDCNEYHALFSYGRLAGVNYGLAPDAEIAATALNKVSPPNARILIAGAADAGMLAFTARATLDRTPIITVVDRCATPLAVCRHYAKTHHLRVSTLQADLNKTSIAGPYDVAFTHNVLLFVPEGRRVTFLTNLGRSLGKGGTLVLINRPRHPKRAEDGALKFGNFTAEIESGLVTRGIPLPESEVCFRRRLEAAAKSERARSDVTLTLQQIEESLTAAGFCIVERVDHHRRRTNARDGGNGEMVPTYVFTATYLG